MSAILDVRTAPRKPAQRTNSTGIDVKLKAMFDQVPEEARWQEIFWSTPCAKPKPPAMK